MVEPGSRTTKIRPPAAAGLFYAGDPRRLQATVSELLGNVPRSTNVMPKALIAPHAGYVYSGRVAAQGVERDVVEEADGARWPAVLDPDRASRPVRVWRL